MCPGGRDEVHEEGMRIFDRAFEFRMELHAYEIRVIWQFDDFNESRFGIAATGQESGQLHIVEIRVIELPAMPVTL